MANLYYIELNFSEIQDSNNSKLIDIHQLDKYLERLENEFLFFLNVFYISYFYFIAMNFELFGNFKLMSLERVGEEKNLE